MIKFGIIFIFLSPFLQAQNLDSLVNAKDYRWLYEQIIAEQSRQELPAESFKSFRVHLLDTYQIFPKPTNMVSKNLKSVKNIIGQITYASVIRKWYKYDVQTNLNNELIHNVRIHLKNAAPADLISFTERLQMAENLWNSGRIQTNFKYSFKFEIVNNPAKAHFSVRIADSTRGPYDTVWGRDWPPNVIAHEVGHMLGLGDEYQTVSGQFDCLRTSIMCTAWSGQLLGHEYYFILRRLF